MKGIRIVDKSDPQVVVPEAIVLAGEALSDIMVRVWFVLKRFAHYEGEVVISNISMEKIACYVGRNKGRVGEAIKQLVKVGLVKVERIPKEQGFGVFNEYELVNPRLWWLNTGKRLREEKRKTKVGKYRNVDKARAVKEANSRQNRVLI